MDNEVTKLMEKVDHDVFVSHIEINGDFFEDIDTVSRISKFIERKFLKIGFDHNIDFRENNVRVIPLYNGGSNEDKNYEFVIVAEQGGETDE